MAGKIILGILVGLAVLILLLLQIPVKIRASYQNGTPELLVRYGPIRRRLFPPPDGKKETDGKKKGPEKAKKADKPKKEKQKKPGAKINREQIFYALEKLPPILGRALRRTGRSIRVDPLKVYVLVAGYDPADTALLYGRLEAAAAAGLPILEKVLRLKDPDVRLYLDFNERELDVIADVGVALRPGSLVWMALRAGGSLLKWFLGFRKLASPPPAAETAEENEKNTSAEEHEAA